MGLKGFIHPVSRQRVAFDAFERDTSRLGRAAFPPWMANFIARKEAGDVRHSRLNLTATRCLSCPRQTFIQTLLGYEADPSERFVMDRGSALHAFAAENWPDSYISESTHRGLLTLSGKLFGVDVSAQTDAMRVERVEGVGDPGRVTEIIDLKFPNDFSVKWRGKAFSDEQKSWVEIYGRVPQPTPKLDYCVQLNIARLLLAQQPWAIEAGYDPASVDLTLWDHACGTSEGPIAFPVPHLDEAQMLQVRPGGGTWTVRQIIDAHVEAFARHEAMAPATRADAAPELCASLPLVGAAGMFGGKKCSTYCDVQSICERLEREYPAGDTF